MKKSFIIMFLCANLTHQGAVMADDDDHHPPKCNDCGVITAVQTRATGGGIGLGAAAGALAGGLLGNQAGKNDALANTVGGTAATIIGVAGGALSGHYAEKAVSGATEWDVTVRMNNGETRTVTMKSDPNLQSGEKVRIAEGSVVRYQEPAGEKKSDDEDDDD